MNEQGDHSLSISQPLLLGISGGQTGVFLWAGPGQLHHLGPARESFSVYCVALAPGGQRFAAGTKTPGSGAARGNVEVWSLPPDGQPASRPGGYSLTFPVYSVDWLDDDLLVVGTGEKPARGRARLFRVGAHNKLASVAPPRPDAFIHDSVVVHVRSLGNDRLLTIGNEGRARIWNLQTGEKEAEAASTMEGPAVTALPASLVMPDGPTVLVQFLDGSIQVLDGSDGWRAETPPALSGSFGGFCSLGQTVLLAPSGSAKASELDPGNWEPVGELNLGSPCRALRPLGPGILAVHHSDFSVSIWQLGEGPRRLEMVSLPPAAGRVPQIVCLGGGLAADQLARQVEDLAARQQAEQLDALRDSFASLQHFNDVRQRMAEALEAGHGFKGLVLLADWCRQQNNPLAELHVRTEMCRDLPNVPPTAVHLHLLAELQAMMGEPGLAVQTLERALACDPDLPGLKELFGELEHLSLPDGPNVLFQVSPGDRGLADACERVQNQILRDFAAGHERPRGYALELRTGTELLRNVTGIIEPGQVIDLLNEEVSGQLQLAECMMVSEDGQQHTAGLIEFHPLTARGDSQKMISLLAEINLNDGRLEYSLFVSIDPQAIETNDNGNPAAFLGPWTSQVALLDQEASWLRQRRQGFEQALQAAAPSLVARTSGASDDAVTDSEPDDEEEFW